MTCEYVSSVIPMLACPSRSETTLGCTPALSSCVACVWRRSWKRHSICRRAAPHQGGRDPAGSAGRLHRVVRWPSLASERAEHRTVRDVPLSPRRCSVLPLATRSPTRLRASSCLLYTSDAADEEDSVDLGGRRI